MSETLRTNKDGDFREAKTGKPSGASVRDAERAERLVVRERGLEPLRESHWILSPARLPVPPLSHDIHCGVLTKATKKYYSQVFCRRCQGLREGLNLSSNSLT